MLRECPYCPKKFSLSETAVNVVRFGSYLRSSDGRLIQRFLCQRCKRSFSYATGDLCFKQQKRQFNRQVASLLVSGVSQRRSALLLKLNRKTIVRKLIFLGEAAKDHLTLSNLKYPLSSAIEFDDLETFEHTKLKPLSVSLAVECKTRRILGFKVSQMPAKGHLAKLSLKKYGYREDHRKKERCRLFFEIKDMLKTYVLIKTDQNPHYADDIKRFFPSATLSTYKGRKSAIVGQGELKKVGFDPIFSINHTCAMLRANINRMFRKTWCTTKKAKRLEYHIALYSVFHNGMLKNAIH